MDSRVRGRIVAAFGAASILSGCAAIDLGTALRYRNTGIEDIDPDTARAAIAFPAGLDLTFTARMEITLGDLDEVFLLEERPPEGGSDLPDAAVDHGAVVYGLPARDVPRAMRLVSLARSEPDLKGSVTTTAAVETNEREAFCEALDEPLGVWTRRRADEPFRRLSSKRTIKTLIGRRDTRTLCETDESVSINLSSED